LNGLNVRSLISTELQPPAFGVYIIGVLRDAMRITACTISDRLQWQTPTMPNTIQVLSVVKCNTPERCGNALEVLTLELDHQKNPGQFD
jgi:hypothetical protein